MKMNQRSMDKGISIEGGKKFLREENSLNKGSEKDIEEYVYKKYKRMIEEDLANRGLFDKLKDAVIKVFK